LRSQRKLNQDQLGRDKALVSQYENGTTMPPIEFLIGAAERLGVSLDHLVRGDESGVAEPQAKYVYPPILKDIRLRAGQSKFPETEFEEIEGRVPIPRSVLDARGWRLERLKVLLTEGLSMFPTINDHEPMVINLDETRLVSGRTFAIQEGDGGPRVKRLYDMGESRIRVASDNQDRITYPDEFITPESEARIVGRAYRLGDLYSGSF
jgi:transcriptional regulator with XRE-family HTH domain